MVAIDRSGLSRRTVLTGAAAVLTASFTGGPGHAAAEASGPTIRSATMRRDEILALTAETDGGYAIRSLTIGDQRADLGERLALALPDGFHPHSMAAQDGTLWITGAIDEIARTVTVDNRIDAVPPELRGLVDPDDADPTLPDGIVEIDVHRARPALLRIRDDEAEFVDLPVPKEIRSGAATTLAVLEDGALAISIEGCSDPDVALIARSHLAVSLDDGTTWHDQILDDGLGEGYGTILAATGGRLWAVTADHAGNQAIRSGGAEADLALESDHAGVGRPMAAVVTAEDQVTLFSDSGGQIRETRLGTDRAPESGATECACTGEIIAIQGLRRAWLETAGDTVHVRQRK